MIAREALNDQVVLIKQSDHADLAAQFAAHFGNEQFVAVQPFDSVVRAATYHDSHFQDVEAKLPIDTARGRPYGHRETPFSQAHLDALQANISWLLADDPYSGMLVSMHHSGLPQNRYGLVSSWQTRGGARTKPRTIRPEVAANIETLERQQAILLDRLVADRVATERQIDTNYRLLQFFDLLSLYLCSDGYQNGKLAPTWIGPVPLNYEGGECEGVHIQPQLGNEIKLSPYPFDALQLRVSVPVRFVQQRPGAAAAARREEVMKASREYLSWVFVR
ncbi:MAG: DUF3891 family protein [Beijerinckiaceae bacterium]|nr:DUF3891 family protein [Beijerinckiaceae bacterium]